MDDSALIIALEAALIHSEIDKDILKFPGCAELVKNSAKDGGYNLPKRETVKSLVHNFGRNIKQCQELYKNSIQEHVDIFKKNIESARKMDVIFKDEEDYVDGEDLGEVTIAKDKRLKIKCPYLNCQIETVKIYRHLSITHKLSEEECRYASKMGLQIAKNCMGVGRVVQTKTKAQPLNSSTCLVARRHNYKVCPECSNLYKNLGQHLKEAHIMTIEDYKKTLDEAQVVPKCYIKFEGAKAVLMQGREFEEAQEINQEEVEKQRKHLEKLKEAKVGLLNLRKKIKEEGGTPSCSQAEDLIKMQANYNQVRHNASAPSNLLLSWKSSFTNHLGSIDHYNPQRSASVALNFLECFEVQKGEPVTAEDINPISIKEMLLAVKIKSTLSACTKIKYSKTFEQLITYLMLDISSPIRKERETPEERAIRNCNYEDIQYVFETHYSQLGKKRGAGLAVTKKRAADKLMTNEEMDKILIERSEYLSKSLDEDYETFDKEKIKEIRNALIAVATIRLGRRTKEIMTMTLDEVSAAEKIVIEGGTVNYIVKVYDQKGLRTGEEAPIAFSNEEYQSLQKYVNILRPKLSIKKNCKTVFTTTIKTKDNNSLSFSGVYQILQLYETTAGKKLSTRAIRGSKVTNSRYLNLSHQEQEDLASSMSHSLSTAQRYYNHKKVTDSVANTLSQKRKLSCSADNIPSLSSTLDSTLDSPKKLNDLLPTTSTPIKLNEDQNDSVISLRCRRVKKFKNK